MVAVKMIILNSEKNDMYPIGRDYVSEGFD